MPIRDAFQAGWYVDPLDPQRQRYWNGRIWSRVNEPIAAGYIPPPAPEGIPAPQIPKGRDYWNLIGVGTGVLLLLGGVVAGVAWIATKATDSGNHVPTPAYSAPVANPAPVDPGPTVHTIIYQLGGSARSADITLKAGEKDSQQRHVSIPITNKSGSSGLRFDVLDGEFLYLSAQNNGGGTITCTITEDGTVLVHNSSRGRFAIATCDGEA